MMLRFAVVGFVSGVLLCAAYLACQYPVLLDTTRSFGPDGDPWSAFMRGSVLPVLAAAGMVGTGAGLTIRWIKLRFLPHPACPRTGHPPCP